MRIKQASIFLLSIVLCLNILAQPLSQTEIARCQKQAQNITIIRDNFGGYRISMAKPMLMQFFGLLYAQCEDDFKRVEMNYIEKLGALSGSKRGIRIIQRSLNKIAYRYCRCQEKIITTRHYG